MPIPERITIYKERESTMKNFLKKITGIEKLEQQRAEALARAAEAIAKEQAATESARLAAMTPKERATEKKEPWVAVLDTHVNEENPRNGFFDLDWNEFFILQLKTAGYDGETDESIVDAWFQDLCRNIGAEQGVSMDRRGAGYININRREDGRSEIG
jgi:hypothetical protein